MKDRGTTIGVRCLKKDFTINQSHHYFYEKCWTIFNQMCENGFMQKGQTFQVDCTAAASNKGTTIILVGIVPENSTDQTVRKQVIVAPGGTGKVGPITVSSGKRVDTFVNVPDPNGQAVISITVGGQLQDTCTISSDQTIHYDVF